MRCEALVLLFLSEFALGRTGFSSRIDEPALNSLKTQLQESSLDLVAKQRFEENIKSLERDLHTLNKDKDENHQFLLGKAVQDRQVIVEEMEVALRAAREQQERSLLHARDGHTHHIYAPPTD